MEQLYKHHYREASWLQGQSTNKDNHSMVIAWLYDLNFPCKNQIQDHILRLKRNEWQHRHFCLFFKPTNITEYVALRSTTIETYLFKRILVKSFRAADLVNILKPHCQTVKYFRNWISSANIRRKRNMKERREGVGKWKNQFKTISYLSITNSRATSQENNEMKTFHQEIAIPCSLKKNSGPFYKP